jgi:hypothetical protein
MLNSWKKRRQLQREIDEIYKSHESEFRSAKTDQDHHFIYDMFQGESAELTRELERMTTIRMRKKAARFGLSLPPFDDDESWYDIPYTGSKALTDTAIAKINREVSDLRFAYWKRWVELLIPILSLITTIIALLKS